MNVIITGASNGIGYHTALRFAQNDNLKLVVLSRDEKRLKQLEKEFTGITYSGKIFTKKFDVSNFDTEVFTKYLDEIGVESVDILINNAGSLINKPFPEIIEQDWIDIYNVNVFGPAKIIQALLPVMGMREKTHIVNIGSYGGFQGSAKFSGLSAYSSSKAALANLTECLAEEFKNKNIFVNCLALGAVQTSMLSKAFPDYKAPLLPYQMAAFIHNFSCTGHNYFNGKILPVTLSTI